VHGQEVVVENVDDYPRVVVVRRGETGLAFPHHRVRIGEGVDGPVQGNAPANFPLCRPAGLPFTKSAIRLPIITSSKGFDK
jgi:hypothetical protein